MEITKARCGSQIPPEGRVPQQQTKTGTANHCSSLIQLSKRMDRFTPCSDIHKGQLLPSATFHRSQGRFRCCLHSARTCLQPTLESLSASTALRLTTCQRTYTWGKTITQLATVLQINLRLNSPNKTRPGLLILAVVIHHLCWAKRDLMRPSRS